MWYNWKLYDYSWALVHVQPHPHTWNSVDLVEDDEPPLLAAHPLHDPLGLPGALGGVAQHGVGADGHRAADGFVFGVRREAADLRVINGGPHLKLGFPLLHRHGGVPQHQAALSHRAGRCYSHQRLPGT